MFSGYVRILILKDNISSCIIELLQWLTERLMSYSVTIMVDKNLTCENLTYPGQTLPDPSLVERRHFHHLVYH